MSDFQQGDDEWIEYEPLTPIDKEDVVSFLADFVSGAVTSESMYRDNFCAIAAGKAYHEFGPEGLCQLMLAIDDRANWISDIIIDAADIDDILYKKYGVFGGDVVCKARQTTAMQEMNQKMWALRRKYTKKIADEIYQVDAIPTESQ